MLKIGITGGMGSGKSTACKIFESLGIPVYYADNRAKWLMVNDISIVIGIKELFGEEAYHDDGSLNRQHIAQIAFNDKQKLSRLNALVHPAVGRDSSKWRHEQTDFPYTLQEAALMFESGSAAFLDKVITVYAPKEARIQRIIDRDETTVEAIEARMNKQMPEEQKLQLADYVIINDTLQSLKRQVVQIHQTLIKLGKKKSLISNEGNLKKHRKRLSPKLSPLLPSILMGHL